MKRKLLCILCLTLCAAGGLFFFLNHNQRSQNKRAEHVLSILLNAPNTDIANMYEEMLNQMSTDKEAQETSVTNAKQTLTDLFENHVTDTFIESCLTINEAMYLQHMAYMEGCSAKAESITISKTQQSHQAAYDATLQLSGDGLDGEKVQVTGLVQFDDTGKIKTITLHGRELINIFQSLS